MSIVGIVTTQLINALAGLECSTRSIACSPDGQQVISGNSTGATQVWDVAVGTLLHELRAGHSDPRDSKACQAVTHSLNGRWIVMGYEDNAIEIYNAETYQSAHTITYQDAEILTIAVSPDSLWMLSGLGDRSVTVWNVETGELTRTIGEHQGNVSAVGFSPDSQWFLSGSDDGTVKIWDRVTIQLIRTLCHPASVRSVAISPDGYQIASSGLLKCFRLYDAATGGINFPLVI